MLFLKHPLFVLLIYVLDMWLPATMFVKSESTVKPYQGIGNHSRKPTRNEAIGYGFLAVTITNLAAVMGVACSLLQTSKYYALLLALMVAIAVGSLVSTAVLVLIPEAFRLLDIDGRDPHWYLPAAVAVCAGAMLFFVLEFLLRRLGTVMERQYKTGAATRDYNNNVYRLPEGDILDKANWNHVGNENSHVAPVFSVDDVSVPPERTLASPTPTGDKEMGELAKQKPITFCTPNFGRRLCNLQPVIWMILIGDGFHNFMDGLTIGTAFTDNFNSGISLSLSILFEELPHELGDFAILVKSGLSVWVALLFNFLSACMAYIGFIIGIVLGEIASASVFIYAITAGFFLYISLADMLPELYESRERAGSKHGPGAGILFCIHCVGLLFGFGCILVITMFGDKIYPA